METGRIACPNPEEGLPDRATLPARREARNTAIRTLEDWELLLAGGGDADTEWP